MSGLGTGARSGPGPGGLHDRSPRATASEPAAETGHTAIGQRSGHREHARERPFRASHPGASPTAPTAPADPAHGQEGPDGTAPAHTTQVSGRLG